MVQIEPFRNYLIEQGKTPGTANSYCSHIRRVDEKIGGLDVVLNSEGIDGVAGWLSRNRSQTSNDERSAATQYLRFANLQNLELEFELPSAVQAEPQRVVFALERDLNAALRKNLTSIESGLTLVDNGYEFPVTTGKIDVLARDQLGQLFVIELKAGPCPNGALEQALGYAQSVTEEYNADEVRVIVIAASFSERIRAAARRIRGVELREYQFELKFHSVI